jgi:hypothetical protein
MRQLYRIPLGINIYGCPITYELRKYKYGCSAKFGAENCRSELGRLYFPVFLKKRVFLVLQNFLFE